MIFRSAFGAAEVSHPAKQGLVQAFSVYVDTLFVCTATAIMILVTGSYNVVNAGGGFITELIPGIEKGNFTQNNLKLIMQQQRVRKKQLNSSNK